MSTLLSSALKVFETTQSKVPSSSFLVCIRNKARKTGSTTANAKPARAKHRGWKRQDGQTVTAGTILATQNTTRWHPGLNVGMGKNGSLYALFDGKVLVSCEKFVPNFKHGWNNIFYAERKDSVIYKKYFNVITEPEHTRFKLISKV